MKTIMMPKMPKVEDRIYRIPCDNPECQALMELGHGELKHTSGQRDGEFWQFSCPHCKRQITVSTLQKFLVLPEPMSRFPIPDR